MKCEPSSLGRACICTFAASDPASFRSAQMRRVVRRSTILEAIVCFCSCVPNSKQRANSDRVVRIHKNRSRCAAAADFFQDFGSWPSARIRVRHIPSAQSAPSTPTAPESINHACAEYPPVDRSSAGSRCSSRNWRSSVSVSSNSDLLRRRDARIRHHPIGNEMALEKTFGETERLRTCEKQFLGLLNFFLSLRVELIHSICRVEKRATHCSHARARVQSRGAHRVRNRSVLMVLPRDSRDCSGAI